MRLSLKSPVVTPVPRQPNWRWRSCYLVLALAAVSLVVAIGAAWNRPEPARPTLSPFPARTGVDLVFGGMPLPPRPELSDLNAAMREDALQVPNTVDGYFDTSALTLPSGSPQFLGRMPAGQAVASDASRGLLFAAGLDGRLRWVDAKTLHPVGECQLPGIAYQLIGDSRHRLLYAALCTPRNLRLGPLGDRNEALGDIGIFDLDALMKQPSSATAVQPTFRVNCSAHIESMLLSPDQTTLYYLAETLSETQLVRIHGNDWLAPQVLRMPLGGCHSLSVSPDGVTLFGLANGRLFAVDTASWQVRWAIRVGGGIRHVEAGPDDRIYLIESRPDFHILVFDTVSRQIQARYRLNIEGKASVCRSLDGRKLILTTSAVTRGQILVFELGAANKTPPRLVGWTQSDRNMLIRGGGHLAGDGAHLLTGVGQVFRVGS